MQPPTSPVRIRPLATAKKRCGFVSRMVADESGQGLIEAAGLMSLLVMMTIYSVDFGYFFIVSANLTSSARTAVQFSIAGYESAGQSTLPTAGPPNTAGTIAAFALADLGGLVKSTTVTAISVCSKGIGTSGNYVKCTNYSYVGGSTPYTTTSTTAAQSDPEAPTFYLNRVDVTYTVQPPIPISLIGTSLVPSLNFHRYLVMRAED